MTAPSLQVDVLPLKLLNDCCPICASKAHDLTLHFSIDGVSASIVIQCFCVLCRGMVVKDATCTKQRFQRRSTRNMELISFELEDRGMFAFMFCFVSKKGGVVVSVC